jgi:hypothetical protein
MFLRYLMLILFFLLKYIMQYSIHVIGLRTGGHKEMSSILAEPIAPSYTSPNAGGGGVAGSHGAQINFGNPTPYFTYGSGA